LTANFYTSI